MIIIQIYEISILSVLHKINELLHFNKLEKKYAPALDNYGQSCFVRSDLKKNEVCLNDAPRLTIKILWTCTPPLCV